MKKWIIVLSLIMFCCSYTEAAVIERNASVAVMDFGTHPNDVPIDINIMNAGLLSSEYITTKLVNDKKINIISRDLIQNKLQEEHISTSGLINPEDAKRIGEMLGVKYLIYGNVNDVTLAETGTHINFVMGGGVDVATVKAHIIARIMEIDTGNIISAVKGEGQSKSSYVKVKSAPVLTLSVGTKTVTQDSVHNALQKASFDVVAKIEAMIK